MSSVTMPPGKLSIDPQAFRENFDRKGFYVKHNLAGHPLFELPALAALSERLAPNLVECDAGHEGAFAAPDKAQPVAMPAKDAILALDRQDARVLLLNIEEDPAYKRLIDDLLDDIQPFSEPSHPGMWARHGFIFLSRRASFTPFHFDPENNFLLQVRGEKTIFMWDPKDREVLPMAAIDNYHAGLGGDPRYSNRKQQYRDEFMQRAWRLPMGPGEGVHFPVHAPHAVMTESDVSVSLSITFMTARSKSRSLVHGANAYLRRFGVSPPAPGTSRAWDAAASVGYRGIRKGYSLLKRLLPNSKIAT